MDRDLDTEPPSAMSPDAEFSGRVHVVAPARLDGSIEGEITAVDRLWIGADARINARVSAPEIIIEGAVRGELHATGRVELRPGARVAADLFTPSLNLQEGALLAGRCITQEPDQS